MIATIPARLKLDNAANIYPASMSKHYSSLYRMKVTIIDPIDTEILQTALLHVSERIPTFRCTLHTGTFWWYLDRCKAMPSVRPLKPLKHFSFSDQDGLLYRVSIDGHAIHDEKFKRWMLFQVEGLPEVFLNFEGNLITKMRYEPVRSMNFLLQKKMLAFFQ